MKKTLFLCLLLFSLTIFSACSGDGVSDSKAEEKESGTGTVADVNKETEPKNNSKTKEDADNTENLEQTATKDFPSGISITSPSKTGNHVTSYNWNVIRGMTSTNTAAIEVNGYRLKKYIAGSQSWNYIAAAKMQTLAEGENEYVIKAFDQDDNVIDETTFHLNYQNGHALPNVGTSLNIILLLTFIFSLNFFIRRQKA